MTVKNPWYSLQEDYEPWSGAVINYELLTEDELELIEEYFEEMYPEGITETEINDFFWFDDEALADILGYDDYETFYEERTKEHE